MLQKCVLKQSHARTKAVLLAGGSKSQYKKTSVIYSGVWSRAILGGTTAIGTGEVQKNGFNSAL